MSESHEAEARSVDRREFLKRVAAAGAAALIPSLAAAQSAAPPAPPAGTAPPAPAPPAAPEGSSADARALTEILRRRWPDRFTEAQWDSITGDFDGDISAGKRLRSAKLANGDEPDFTFHA
jgi:hypothetical protein